MTRLQTFRASQKSTGGHDSHESSRYGFEVVDRLGFVRPGGTMSSPPQNGAGHADAAIRYQELDLSIDPVTFMPRRVWIAATRSTLSWLRRMTPAQRADVLATQSSMVRIEPQEEAGDESGLLWGEHGRYVVPRSYERDVVQETDEVVRAGRLMVGHKCYAVRRRDADTFVITRADRCFKVTREALELMVRTGVV